jgi:ABC-type bacteriocin/lantibiotic exporter with double-glycine peptidase domain
MKIKPVVQEDQMGCGIACAAMLSNQSYQQARKIAEQLGISADDPQLGSDTKHVRKLLAHLKIEVSNEEESFQGWNHLPDRALLAIKWHLEKGTPFWHWTVFVREGKQGYVLDPKKALKKNLRTDFGRMKPKWFIEVFL